MINIYMDYEEMLQYGKMHRVAPSPVFLSYIDFLLLEDMQKWSDLKS